MFFVLLSALSVEQQELIQRLFAQHQYRLQKLVVRFLHSEQDAEEVVQQAFLKIAQQAPRLEHLPAEKLPAYLYVMVRNAAFDHLRLRRRFADLQELEDVLEDTAPGVEHLLEKSWDIQCLRRAMCLLPDEDSRLLQFYWAQELTYREIAGLLGITEAAAKKRGQRALQKLRRIYKEIQGEGAESHL